MIGRGRNRVFTAGDTTLHAEIMALQDAAFHLIDSKTKQYRPWGHILYTTMEPCLLCTGALIMSHIKAVVWALTDPANGALNVLQAMPWPASAHHLSGKIARIDMTPEPYPDLAARQIMLMKQWNASRGRPGIVFSQDVW